MTKLSKGQGVVVVEDQLTEEEREAVTIVFHQFETGLREGTIYTKVTIAKLFKLNWTNS